MPTIDVSNEQRAFLQALRDELQNEVQYGSVREQDALQYLIDHFEGGGDLDVDADVEVDDSAVAEASEEASESTSADGGAVTADADAGDGAGSTAEASDDGGSSSGGSSSDTEQDGEDRLNAMMNLLDTHDDKWGEASKEDARYEVDMPDGTTEYVQTKDDVRAHIFKNYD
jgi:hypothetical protein